VISDEYGTPVLVKADSPANKYVNFLKAQGFGWIVLQRKLFLGLTKPSDYATMDIGAASAPFYMEKSSPPRTVPPGTTDVKSAWRLLHIRLLDCITVLNREGVD
jgi:hypothetical protein